MKVNIENQVITLPDQRNYESSYLLAFKLASEKLINLEALIRQCENSESICRISGSSIEIQIRYLNQAYKISFPDIEVSFLDNHREVELKDKVLILDYLTKAKGTPLSGIPITYQELREGAAYYPSFFNRAIKPLIANFGNCPKQLIDIATELAGTKAKFGDIAVTIPAFNRVPITLVLWKGDEEFPPNANILFDDNIQDYLSTEDIVVLCQTIVWKLVKSL